MDYGPTLAMTCAPPSVWQHPRTMPTTTQPPVRRPGSRGPLPGQGAGGRPEKDFEDKVQKIGIAMLPQAWRDLDDLRGSTPRGTFVARLIAAAKSKP